MLYFAPWKVALVAILCVLGLAFTVPNFVSEKTAEGLPDWLPHKQVNLGLDLQGGSHLLLEVEAAVVVEERLAALVDSVRPALRSKRIGYRALGQQDNAVTVTIRKPEQLEQALSEIRKLAVPVQANAIAGIAGGQDILVEVVDGNKIQVTLTEEAIRERRRSAIEQSIEIVRRRIDELGTREPTIQRQGDERILVQVPGLQDPERLKNILGKTAKMVFRLVDVTTSPAEIMGGARTPPGSELLESDERRVGEDGGDGGPANMFVVRKRVMVSGDTLVDSSATFQDNMPVVSFRFDSVGAKRFGDATAKNVGRPFAIVLDRRVISAPVIREPILGGTGIISGNFTVQEVQDLSLLLRAGALPAPLKILEERTVGPALGADSVAAGKIACIIAFVAVMIFMVLSYGIFGLVADVALIINLFLIMGALSVLQATLTLPGIAGIVLTIGMAVDANVLVFERIREEIRTGKTPFAAMEAGYRRAVGTIFDANITTFIAAVILFVMGSGPIKGFSVTLGIGIVTSVFTAVVVTRMIMVFWLRRTRPVALPI
ncbi:MAG: protein translocase subunit SecD [Alphaproteobacteria bacterium]|jgi:preprotein translocase subunit SecD|nr:protein translocase subunit SecD [Rhodospirillaceae bacterium]MDP6021568.1 protein translocase subunit SecD [Alphaproteobacteria bacterium]MDP6256482.1 protein translocase subunit SecD [Alphaproteobacteria bacterium]MDP7056329.1 protein translocase subunit SecD [Alphaproteobacteria bacterium]MDP7228365.1 protein translocase subunit SecD [Alphaproteobacteria bacterium]|tara:strand:- start:712 stop:2349 length:1638 start_codon:yes stop_codon:yes gene_type:complete